LTDIVTQSIESLMNWDRRGKGAVVVSFCGRTE